MPAQPNGDHPQASIATGHAYVTNLINTIMRGPDWKSTAIFLTWDDWGGFYDHVAPQQVARPGTDTACAFPRWSSAPTPRRTTSTTRSCPSTPSTSSSKMTSCAATGSTLPPTAAPTRARQSGKPSAYSATCSPSRLHPDSREPAMLLPLHPPPDQHPRHDELKRHLADLRQRVGCMSWS